MEAQAQKLLLEQQKPKEEEEGKKEPLSMEVDEAEPKDTIKDPVDVETEEKPPEESKKDEVEEKPIDIDPKTYCKLGHFHLLLEDYAKGKRRRRFLSEKSCPTRNFHLQRCRLIRSTGACVTTTGRTRRSCTVLGSSISTSTRCDGE